MSLLDMLMNMDTAEDVLVDEGVAGGTGLEGDGEAGGVAD